MITIDLSAQVVLLNGKRPTVRLPTGEEVEAPDESYGQAVAEHVLARSAKGPAMKFMAWARTLHANEVLTLDKTDLEVFRKAIEDSEVLTNLVKGPVLEKLLDAQSPKLAAESEAA